MELLDSRFWILNTLRATRAQSALSTIFLIGGVIVLFGVSMAMISLSFANSTLGFRAANQALATADGGVRDAELQLLRNKDFSNTSGYCVPYYATLPCPQGYAQVTVTPNSPITGETTVVSSASVGNRQRKIQGVYSVSPVGLVVPLTIQELSL